MVKKSNLIILGVELTDFLLVLNTKEAVKTSSHSRTIKLGGNVTSNMDLS
jgi:lipid-binding SYLF domain-containing protein